MLKGEFLEKDSRYFLWGSFFLIALSLAGGYFVFRLQPVRAHSSAAAETERPPTA